MSRESYLEQADAPLAVGDVVVNHVLHGFVEEDATDLRCDRYALRGVALAEPQQRPCVLALRAVTALLVPLAGSVVPNPPDVAALLELAHRSSAV